MMILIESGYLPEPRRARFLLFCFQLPVPVRFQPEIACVRE